MREIWICPIEGGLPSPDLFIFRYRNGIPVFNMPNVNRHLDMYNDVIGRVVLISEDTTRAIVVFKEGLNIIEDISKKFLLDTVYIQPVNIYEEESTDDALSEVILDNSELEFSGLYDDNESDYGLYIGFVLVPIEKVELNYMNNVMR